MQSGCKLSLVFKNSCFRRGYGNVGLLYAFDVSPAFGKQIDALCKMLFSQFIHSFWIGSRLSMISDESSISAWVNWAHSSGFGASVDPASSISCTAFV